MVLDHGIMHRNTTTMASAAFMMRSRNSTKWEMKVSSPAVLSSSVMLRFACFAVDGAARHFRHANPQAATRIAVSLVKKCGLAGAAGAELGNARGCGDHTGFAPIL